MSGNIVSDELETSQIDQLEQTILLKYKKEGLERTIIWYQLL